MIGPKQSSELSMLEAAIANSPIVVASPPGDFADWCAQQKPDADSVILDWLRAQRPARPRIYS